MQKLRKYMPVVTICVITLSAIMPTITQSF